LPKAILEKMEALEELIIPGLGTARFQFRRSCGNHRGSGSTDRFCFYIEGHRNFHRRMRAIIGWPAYRKERYLVALQRLRKERAAAVESLKGLE